MMNQLVQQIQMIQKQMELIQASNGRGGGGTSGGKHKRGKYNEMINPRTGKP